MIPNLYTLPMLYTLYVMSLHPLTFLGGSSHTDTFASDLD